MTVSFSLFPTNRFVHIPIPEEARFTSTRFRWWQPRHSGEGMDQWALDNILIAGVASGEDREAALVNIILAIEVDPCYTDNEVEKCKTQSIEGGQGLNDRYKFLVFILSWCLLYRTGRKQVSGCQAVTPEVHNTVTLMHRRCWCSMGPVETDLPSPTC